MDVIESARAFMDIGCRVGPVGGKDPGAYLGTGWPEKWTRDIDQVAEWFKRWPRANLGILPDQGCCPLDVDNSESFERLQVETVVAPPTPRY